MGMKTGEVNVVHIVLVCDQCEKQAEFDVPNNGQVVDAEEFGWLEFNNPVDTGSVQFHTRRCAIGFFRDVVKDAGQPAEEVDEDDPGVDHDVDED